VDASRACRGRRMLRNSCYVFGSAFVMPRIETILRVGADRRVRPYTEDLLIDVIGL